MVGDHYDSIPPSGQRGSVACACDSAGRRSVRNRAHLICAKLAYGGAARFGARGWNPETNLGDRRLGPLPASTTRRGHFHCRVPHRMALVSGSLDARFFINRLIVERLGGVRACRVPNINQVSCQQGYWAK
jgi:hypothetical protein